MSDCYSAVTYVSKESFGELLEALVQSYEDNRTDYAQIHDLINKVHPRFIEKDLFRSAPSVLIDVLIARFSRPETPSLEELFFILLCLRQFVLMIRLQKATKYRDRIMIFVDEKGAVMENGVHYQDSSLKFMDGDQDILLGIAKKRCWKKSFIGRPTILVAEKNYYHKSVLVLRDVITI